VGIEQHTQGSREEVACRMHPTTCAQEVNNVFVFMFYVHDKSQAITSIVIYAYFSRQLCTNTKS